MGLVMGGGWRGSLVTYKRLDDHKTYALRVESPCGPVKAGDMVHRRPSSQRRGQTTLRSGFCCDGRRPYISPTRHGGILSLHRGDGQGRFGQGNERMW
jgi:hypothetical protein